MNAPLQHCTTTASHEPHLWNDEDDEGRGHEVWCDGKPTTPPEKRYTLDEAVAELNRRACSEHGHEWQTIANAHGTPITIFCGRCHGPQGTIVWEA